MRKAKFVLKFNSLVLIAAESERLHDAVHEYGTKNVVYDFDNMIMAIETSSTTKSPMIFDRVTDMIELAVNKGMFDISKLPQFKSSVQEYITHMDILLRTIARDESLRGPIERYISRLAILRKPCRIIDLIDLLIISIKLVNRFKDCGADIDDIYHIIENVAVSFPTLDIVGTTKLINLPLVKNKESDYSSVYRDVVLEIWNELNSVLMRILSLFKLYYGN